MSQVVSIKVRRKVKPGREAEYESWLHRFAEGAERDFDGFLGVEVMRPGDDGVYRNIFRFDSIEHLERFEQSDFRLSMMREGAPLFEGDSAWERMTGLEFWFDPPPGTQVPKPHPHRMLLVMICVIFALSLTLNLTIAPLMIEWPLHLRLLVIVTTQTSLMSYVIMPRLTPRIAHFIYPSEQGQISTARRAVDR